jgi:hypothetical protein
VAAGLQRVRHQLRRVPRPPSSSTAPRGRRRRRSGSLR